MSEEEPKHMTMHTPGGVPTLRIDGEDIPGDHLVTTTASAIAGLAYSGVQVGVMSTRVRKTVERDAAGLITAVVEERVP